MNRIKDILRSGEAFRYLIAGIVTTGVNLVVFALLRYGLQLSLVVSNFIAIVVAILFAFVSNKFYTFRARSLRIGDIVTEFVWFVGGRLITMAIEIGGVYILAVWFGIHDFIAKLLIQVVVVIANYIISKVFVFKDREQSLGDWAKKQYVYLLAFFVPMLLFLLVCLRFSVTPFGDKTLMIIDSLHQYLPLLR